MINGSDDSETFNLCFRKRVVYPTFFLLSKSICALRGNVVPPQRSFTKAVKAAPDPQLRSNIQRQ